MKLRELTDLNDELALLLRDYKMPISLKYQLNVLLQSVVVYTKPYGEVRDAYIQEHGNLIPNTNQYVIPHDKYSFYLEEIESLLDKEIEIKLPSIKLSIIEKIEDTGKGNFPILFSLIEE